MPTATIRKIVLIGLLLLFAAPARSAPAGGGEAAVVRWVADGDTVILEDGRYLRYAGINCPEVAHDRDPAEPFGAAARSLNRELVADRQIRIVVEGKDRYGRILGAVFLPDGTFVNQALVAAGLAYVLPSKESRSFVEPLLAAQREAMTTGRGFWARLDRRPISLVANRRSRRFHRADCPFAKKIGKRQRVAFPDFHQAFAAGFAPCGQCFQRMEEYIKVKSDECAKVTKN
jgi:endonuclease YncB( thermonuclease family)